MIIVRPIWLGSLEEVIFWMDSLHRVERLGVKVINPPSLIEKCVNKFYTLSLLSDHGIRVPRTLVTQNVREALEGFDSLRSLRIVGFTTATSLPWYLAKIPSDLR